MAINSYQDGFPKQPLDAIEFSYFLSDDEKNEWREWVNTATEEQKAELVETLHAMWQENQKQVVPSGFGVQSPAPLSTSQQVAPSAPAPSPAPKPMVDDDLQKEFEALQNTSPISAPKPVTPPPAPVPPSPAPAPKPVEAVSGFDPQPQPPLKPNAQPKPQQPKQKKQKPVNSKTPSESLGKPSFDNNPILDAMESDDSDIFDPKEKSSVGPDKKKKINQKQAFFNVSKVREATTRAALDNLYQNYLSSREKSFESAHQYEVNHGMFLDKVMDVVINFEQVSDYFESMSHKLIEMNDKIVEQAVVTSEVQTKMSNFSQDHDERIDEMQRDIDRLFREVKNVRTGMRDLEERVTRSLSAYGADSYNQDGILQRIDLLSAKVHQLQQAQTPTQSSRLKEEVKSKIAKNRNPSKKPIDLRNQI